MNAQWKEGDVVVIDFVSGPERAMWVGGEWVVTGGRSRASNYLVARPLVVIDPEDREQADRLCRTWFGGSEPALEASVDDMQAALRSLIAPPKPDEPGGKYAVVVDADGNEWVKCANNGGPRPWLRNGYLTRAKWTAYADIRAVRVLSEGVEVDR